MVQRHDRYDDDDDDDVNKKWENKTGNGVQRSI